MTKDFIKYERRGRVAWITLDRPEKLNAITDDMVVSLKDAFHRFDVDGGAWVAILSGEGRAFSTGADVLQRQLRPREELEQFGSPQRPGANASELFAKAINWKPLIVAAHGYAMGMALGFALEADLLVVTSDLQLQVTETPRGLQPVRYWALLRYRARGAFADDVAITGRFFTGEEAFREGVATRVVRPGKHREAAEELAETILQHPPLGIRAVVRARRWYMDQLEREAYLQTSPLKLHLTEDFHESARAFAEKREPGAFYGR